MYIYLKIFTLTIILYHKVNTVLNNPHDCDVHAKYISSFSLWKAKSTIRDVPSSRYS